MLIVGIFLLSLFVTSLWGVDCYSIQIKSVLTKSIKNNNLTFKDNSCRLFEIGKYSTLRCGCYSNMDRARKGLALYQGIYHDAFIAKKRFYPLESIQKDANISLLSQNTNNIIDKNKIKILKSKVEKPKKDKVKKIKWNEVVLNKSADFNLTNQNKLETQLLQNYDTQKKLISESSDFYGLNLHGKYAQYIEQNYLMREYTDYEYEIKAKFELFDNGYFAQKTKKEKQFEFSQLNYFNDLSKMQQNHYLTRVLKIDMLKSEANREYYLKLSRLYAVAIESKQENLTKSLITRYELVGLEQMHNRFKLASEIYENDSAVSIENEYYSLLKIVDFLQLKDIKKIIQITKKSNPDMQLQNAKMKYVNIDESYLDTISMNIFVHRRVVDEMGWYHTVGLEGNIPINFSADYEHKLRQLKEQSYAINQKSIEEMLESKLDSLYNSFSMIQKHININKHDINYTEMIIEDFEKIKANIVPNLNINIDDKILTSQKEIVDYKFKILLQKIELIKILNDIAYISNVSNITSLIKEME
ncbi:MAG: hypothetical protein U9N52_13570 [Campylobacterota bacterium]|nr:hypothetical protein [Campylobacterota bacterium]